MAFPNQPSYSWDTDDQSYPVGVFDSQNSNAFTLDAHSVGGYSIGPETAPTNLANDIQTWNRPGRAAHEPSMVSLQTGAPDFAYGRRAAVSAPFSSVTETFIPTDDPSAFSPSHYASDQVHFSGQSQEQSLAFVPGFDTGAQRHVRMNMAGHVTPSYGHTNSSSITEGSHGKIFRHSQPKEKVVGGNIPSVIDCDVCQHWERECGGPSKTGSCIPCELMRNGEGATEICTWNYWSTYRNMCDDPEPRSFGHTLSSTLSSEGTTLSTQTALKVPEMTPYTSANSRRYLPPRSRSSVQADFSNAQPIPSDDKSYNSQAGLTFYSGMQYGYPTMQAPANFSRAPNSQPAQGLGEYVNSLALRNAKKPILTGLSPDPAVQLALRNAYGAPFAPLINAFD